ncbi:MAG TPA: alpha/beta hydrolase-fold protein [Opitutaceae bacterium]|nr:alpha/beta hydrolase-fold protein [Opitutaceae bacterium]
MNKPLLALVFLTVTSALLAQPAATPASPPAAAPAAARPAAPRNRNDAFYKLGPDSQPMEGVPKGKFVGPKIIPSNVFPGTQHTYYVYVPAQYDPSKPTAVMIFNDGQAMMAEPGDVQGQNVLDNLIYRREIPVMLGVFINPGRRPDQPEPVPSDWGDRTTNRADEYNPPNDKYARVVTEELMPALRKDYNISPDPELHGIMGASSGGCAAFGVVWFRPNDFHKVITIVGSFTDLRGEYIYPELVADSERKPFRIYMQDGRNDNRVPGNPKRDWFLQNVRLKDALLKKGYDVAYTWGIGNHGQKQGGAVFPEMMRWLWRDQPVSVDPDDQVERAFRPAIAAPVEK